MSIVRPYGDTTGDGMVQLSFTLPVAHDKRAEGAAIQLAGKMGMDPAMLVHARQMGDGFTFFVVYGRIRVENHHRSSGSGGGPVVDENQVPGHNTVAGFQRRTRGNFGAVQDGSVLASEIAQVPRAMLALESQVLARKAGVIGVAEFRGARAAEGHALSF